METIKKKIKRKITNDKNSDSYVVPSTLFIFWIAMQDRACCLPI